MFISVVVFADVHARVVVQRIEDAQGREVTSGCAVMAEGTEFVIATRSRQIAEDVTPMWAILRSHPYFTCETTALLTDAGVSLLLNPATAKRYHWHEGLVVGFWDLARMSQLLESRQVTPSFLRTNAWKAPIRYVNEIPDGVCYCTVLGQTSNVIVFPNPEENVRHVTDKDVAEECLLFSSCKEIDFDKVAAVHGGIAQELLRHLSSWFARTKELSGSSGVMQGGNCNVLLCGGKGYGKTTLAAAVLNKLQGVHVCVVQCTCSGNRLLHSLQKALVECILCAPSVLILDNFDGIAPVQRDGAVTAVSGTTRSILEEMLRCFTDTLTFIGRSSVVVLATCGDREAVHERLRSANCFAKVMKLEALDRKAHLSLLKQMFPKETTDTLEKLASLMENYTPFDIKRVSVRIKNGFMNGNLPSLEKVKEVIACFTPLSHTGISFLKGEKRSLDSIGGLSDAKKILYDTLVLPIKHPELFARLPLKTRSGILLYGPSGCGKTFLVEALVNATDLNCIVVNGPEVFGKYIGQSEQKIRDVFERAQAAAPCVIFFDEFDSVAPQRGVDNSGVTDRVVNQLLCYLDGVEGRKDVYVVAASSRPDLIDAALLRPGRLDKAVECPIPSYEERLEILLRCFKEASANLSQREIEGLARQTDNWTPADLSGLVSSAHLFVTRRVIEQLSLNSMETNSEQCFAVTNVGKGTTREKVEDALKPIFAIGKRENALELVTQMGMEDVQQALAITRPSLTYKDISDYERIRCLFTGQGVRDITANVGKKLAFK
ncbi:peroxisome biosynthesis protein-like protein [Trypanosoma rangeli]|uniref:Peroxisome biosynthesis protein-like protein n=1 Tax=Trypanosoma rangeli TaxID=5698 RepID=A0A3R7MK02_TRYRA|nr:peroxisome biosynthesis protein-like protein [Trypanosoma rangeli]RNF03916.1 peroxisome biosynthesis protein-like protein [Trypanosoma rangeli]|eukprot:RNF03916.1 peroxisome biosynthesis protein-like protein [Trypanosoma rangeli]